MKIYRIAEELSIPNKLYHATYQPLMEGISRNGLGGVTRTNYEDSVAGVVYLAPDKYVAESYAETSDLVPEQWLDQIIILEVATEGLDGELLRADNNNLQGDTFEYHGVIPSGSLRVA